MEKHGKGTELSRWLWLGGIAGVFALAGCASSGAEADLSLPSAPTGSFSAGSNAVAEVSVTHTGKGLILIGPTGHALYVYDADTARASACTGFCADSWPPLIGRPVGGAGIDASELATITRADGAKQVTYDDHPLYYFSKDIGIEDVSGDDVAGIWHVAKVDEEPSREPRRSTGPPPSEYHGG